MADQTRNIIVKGQFQDGLTGNLAAAQKAADQLKSSLQDLSTSSKTGGAGLTDLERQAALTAQATDRLYERLQALTQGGQTVDQAITEVSGSFSELYAEGMSTADAVAALEAAVARLDEEASGASGGVADLAGASGDLDSSAAGAEGATSGASDAVGTLAGVAEGATHGVQGLANEVVGLVGNIEGIPGGAAAAVAGLAAISAAAGQLAGELAGMAAVEEVSEVRLAGALRANIENYQQYGEAIQQAIIQGQDLAFSDDQIRDTLSRVIPITKDMEASLRVLSVAQDMARGTGMDLERAALLLARAHETGGSVLKRYGVIVSDTATSEEILAAVQKQFAGQAEDFSKTTAANVARTTIALDNLKETAGTNLLQATDEGSGGVKGLAETLEQTIAPGTAAGDMLAGLGSIIVGKALEPLRELNQSAQELNDIMGTTADGVGAATADISGYFESVSTDVERSSLSYYTYRDAQAAGLADAVDNAETAGSDIVAALDLVAVLQANGAAAGTGFGEAVATAIQQARVQINHEATAVVGIVNTVIAAINLMRQQVALANIRSYDDIEDMRSGQRDTVPAATQQENLRKLKEQYETKYGTSPTTGAAIKPKAPPKPKAGAKGKSPEQLAKEAERAADALERARDRLEAAQQAIERLGQEKQLESARGAVEASKAAAQEQSDFWDRVIASVRDKLAALETEERDFLAPMRAELAAAEGDLKRFRERSEEALHGMDVQLRALGIAMRELRKESATALAPFEASVERAQEKLRGIQEEARRTAHEFELLRRPLEDSLYAVNLAIDAQSERVAALRAEVDTVAESYDRLLAPLQKRLEELTHQQEKLNRAQELGKMAIAVGNLTARLKNAGAGSREAASLTKDLAQAQEELNLKTEQYSVEDQIRAAELQKKAAVELAEERAKAAERDLQILEQQGAAIQRQIDLLNRQEELQQRAIADREYAAQDELTQAEAALAAEQKVWAEREKNLQAEIDKLGEIREQRAFDDSESERLQQKEIGRIQERITFWQGVFQTKRDGLQEEKDGYEDLKAADLAVMDQVVAGAQARLTALQGVIDAARAGDKETQAQADLVEAKAGLAEAQANVIATAHATLKEAVPETDALKTKTEGAKLAAQGLATALGTELAPAIANMTTVAAPQLAAFFAEWEKYFGAPATGDEKAKILWLMSNRNNAGFFAWLSTYTTLALGVDGWRGVWNNRLNELFMDVSNKLDTEKVNAATKGAEIGGALIDGMTAGAQDIAKNAALQAAVAQAVEDAIAAGKAAAGIASPSKVAARELGMPIPEGAALGVRQGTPVLAGAVRSMMDQAFAPFGGGGGGLGYAGGMGGSGAMAYAPLVGTGGDSYTSIEVNLPDGTPLPTTPQGWLRHMKPLDEAARMYAAGRGKTGPGRPLMGSGGARARVAR